MPSPADDNAHPREAAAPRKSQVYVYEDGFMFACEGMSAPRTERFTATLLFATSEDGLDIEVGEARHRAQVAVLRPFLPKTLHAAAQPFVSVGVNSTHACYRAFTRMQVPGYAFLSPTLMPALAPRLQALRRGELDLWQARQVFEQCIEAVTPLLPPLRPLDPRIAQVMAMLAHDPRQPLETLAARACLSYYRMSHLFSHEMGVSLRQYVLSLKIHAAARCIGRGLSLTATAHEAGFTDSAHLSRVWTKAFGGPPSHFLNARAYAIKTAPETTPPLPKAA
jgi:AraC-like DNA-binding protein